MLSFDISDGSNFLVFSVMAEALAASLRAMLASDNSSVVQALQELSVGERQRLLGLVLQASDNVNAAETGSDTSAATLLSRTEAPVPAAKPRAKPKAKAKTLVQSPSVLQLLATSRPDILSWPDEGEIIFVDAAEATEPEASD